MDVFACICVCVKGERENTPQSQFLRLLLYNNTGISLYMYLRMEVLIHGKLVVTPGTPASRIVDFDEYIVTINH